MQKLVNACENTVMAKFSYIPNRLSICTLNECTKFMLAQSPYNTSMFNIAWLKSVNKDDFKNELLKVIKNFAPHPFALWLGPNSSPRGAQNELAELGFVKEAHELGMSLNLRTYNDDAHTVKTTDIFEVKDKTGMEHFIHVLEAYDPYVREYYLKVIDELGTTSHPFRFFWLSVDGKAACITSLFFNGDHCGIFDVLTHEDHRKKGYAYRLMKHVLSTAKKQGSAHMCLTASSPEAVNLYRKMGFDNFGDYECYEFKAHATTPH